VRRVYRFRRDLDLSIVSQHRTIGPPGLAEGGSGAPGRQQLLRADGSIEPLAALAACRVHAGDRLEILTPGGGGWGRAANVLA
jgi:5-oxoprolinase (ATP-hydrolysing)